tara:strand:- start:914 stop:1108 length:195 start_codon:yes stop_codon:yes gene_type:complete
MNTFGPNASLNTPPYFLFYYGKRENKNKNIRIGILIITRGITRRLYSRESASSDHESSSKTPLI